MLELEEEGMVRYVSNSHLIQPYLIVLQTGAVN